MKISPSLLVAALALVLNFVPRSFLQTQDRDPLLSLSETYLERLCAQDFEALGPLLDANALFEDPTRVTLTGKVQRIQGRAAMLDNFAKNARGQGQSKVEIVETFVTGEHVVMRLNYISEGSANVIRVEGEAPSISLVIPAVTILRIQKGRVVHHLDHVDYASILRQVADEQK